MSYQDNNPTLGHSALGLDGVEFVEFAVQMPEELDRFFRQLGFRKTGVHRSKPVALYQQGDINFIINADPRNGGQAGLDLSVPVINAVGLRVHDAASAYKTALSRGAWEVDLPAQTGVMELNIPAVQSVAGSLIYFIDRYGKRSIYDVDFVLDEQAQNAAAESSLFQRIRHITVAVNSTRALEWSEFFQRLFGFQLSEASLADSLESVPNSYWLRCRAGKTVIHVQGVEDRAARLHECLASVVLTSNDLSAVRRVRDASGGLWQQGTEQVDGTGAASASAEGTISLGLARASFTIGAVQGS